MVMFTYIRFPISLAEAAKEAEVDYEDEMNGLQSDDDDDDDDGSDGEMGMDDIEDGDEAQSAKLQKLAAQVCQVFTYFCEAWFFFLIFFLLALTVSQFVYLFHRQRPSTMMMMMTMILMMTLVMRTSFSHPSMRWMPLYSLSMQSEVPLYKIL